MRVSNTKRGSNLESTPEGSEYSDTDLKLENLQSGFRDRRRSSSIENYRSEGLLRRLREAQGFIEEVVAEKELLLELVQTERALHYWRLGVVFGQAWTQIKSRTAQAFRKKLLAKALGNWALLVSGQQHLKFSISNIILSRENSMSKATLLAWAYYVRNVRQNSAFVQSMIRRKDNICYKTGFEQWCQHSRLVKRISSLLTRRAYQRRRDLLGTTLALWLDACIAERKHNKILQLTRARAERREMKTLLSVWSDVMRRKRRMTTALSQLLFRTNTRTIQTVLAFWFDLMSLNRKLRRSAQTIIGRVRTMLLSRGLFTWVQVCRRKLGLYGKLHSKESRSSKAALAKWLNAWTRYMAYQTKSNAMLTNRAVARKVASLADSIGRWRGLSQESKRLQRTAMLLEGRRASQLSSQCLLAWYWLLQTELEAVDAEKAANRKVEAKVRVQEQALCRQVLRRWTEEAGSARWQVEEAEKMRGRGEQALLRGVVGDWQMAWSRQMREALEEGLAAQQQATLVRRNGVRRTFGVFCEWRAACAYERHLRWAEAAVESWRVGRELEVLGGYVDAWRQAVKQGRRTARLMEWMAKREAGLYKAEVTERWQTAVYEDLKAAAIVERSSFLHNLLLLMKPFLVLHFALLDSQEEQRRADSFRYKVVCGAAFKGWYDIFWWRRQAQVVAGRFARRAEHWADRKVKTMLEQWAAFVDLVKLLRRGQARACLLLWTNTKREYWTRWARRVDLCSEARRRGREALQGRALRAWHDSMGVERGQRILDLIAEASFSLHSEDGDDSVQAAMLEAERGIRGEGEEGDGEDSGGAWEREEQPGMRLADALRAFGQLEPDASTEERRC